GATLSICELAPGRLTVTLAAVPPGLRTWMLSLNMPAEALSYQFTKLVVGGWAALWAHTSLKVCWNWHRWEATTAGPEVTVTGPPIVPCGSVTYVSWPAAALQAAPGYPATVTHPELALAPVLRMWMLSPTMPGEALSYQFR